MNPELIAAINRLAAAQEKLAEAHARIADALHYTEGKVDALTFADGLVYQLGRVADGLERIEDRMPEPPETDLDW